MWVMARAVFSDELGPMGEVPDTWTYSEVKRWAQQRIPERDIFDIELGSDKDGKPCWVAREVL